MLYFFFYESPWLRSQLSLFNVVRYITVRTAAAAITALVLSLILGPWLIRKLREFQIGQIIRTDGPESHRVKSGTPTMGGLLILTATLVPTLLWANLRNPYVWIAVLTTLAYGAIGFADDYLKIVRKTHDGLLPRYKLLNQIIVGVAVGLVLLWMQNHGLYSTRLIFPFFKRLIPDLG
jgi:phospho-N-acetylmuramoyl-pentapeptide-transferase